MPPESVLRPRPPGPLSTGRPRLLLTLVLPVLSSACGAPPEPGPAEHRRIWEAARPFGDFLASVEAREETWRDNWARAEVPGPVLERARAVAEPGWRLLVVADDWCGDSAHTLPYVARLVEAVEALDLRVVGSNLARPVMLAHPTPDGRAASPTMVLLDGAFVERGCFVERPPELQRWVLENPDDLAARELSEVTYARYEADAGRSTVEEIVRVLEAAATGDVRCGGPS